MLGTNFEPVCSRCQAVGSARGRIEVILMCFLHGKAGSVFRSILIVEVDMRVPSFALVSASFARVYERRRVEY